MSNFSSTIIGLIFLVFATGGISAQDPVSVQSPLTPPMDRSESDRAEIQMPIPEPVEEPLEPASLPEAFLGVDESGDRASQDWRILVVNDDGVDAPGLRLLVETLGIFADVVVSAPDGNRSGASHSFSAFSQAQTVRRLDIPGAVEAVSTSGTPADAVDFGLRVLGAERSFDLVVSGINRGANVGEIAHLSGTVGAAMHGALHGVPAIAVSLDARATDPRGTARFTASFVRDYLNRGATPGIVLSINVPQASADEPLGTLIAPMGGRYAQIESYQRISIEADGAEVWRGNVVLSNDAPPGSDTLGYLAGLITITPLAFDWTDRASVDRLRTWAQTWASDGQRKLVPAEPLPPG